MFYLQGIMDTEKPIFTAQFHPEAFGGPTDTEVSCMAHTGWGLGFKEAPLVGVVTTSTSCPILELLFCNKFCQSQNFTFKITVSCYDFYFCKCLCKVHSVPNLEGILLWTLINDTRQKFS